MSEKQNDQEEAVNEIYQYAANLLVEEKKTTSEAKKILIEQGLDSESASVVIENIEKQIKEAKSEGASKDMLYGGLWFVGGLVATAAEFGYVFWGAMIFGAIQFIKGAVNSSK